MASAYTFDNDRPTATDLLAALGQMLDEFSTARLRTAGVPPGARCLEVGAGAGSVAVWLAGAAGPTGEVIATDIKPQHIPEHPRIVPLAHDITRDPLPDGRFDIIHARSVLAHLPQRHAVLARLAAALRPGGVLVVEDMEARWGSSVLATPDPRLPEIMAAYETAMARVLVANGNDQSWARSVYAAMRDAGLAGLDTQGWHGSSPGGQGACLLAWSGSTELRDPLIKVGGMDPGDLDRLAELALDPRVVLRGILLVSTIGRRP